MPIVTGPATNHGGRETSEVEPIRSARYLSFVFAVDWKFSRPCGLRRETVAPLVLSVPGIAPDPGPGDLMTLTGL